MKHYAMSLLKKVISCSISVKFFYREKIIIKVNELLFDILLSETI